MATLRAADGLDPLRELASQLDGWLAPEGVLGTQVTEEQVARSQR